MGSDGELELSVRRAGVVALAIACSAALLFSPVRLCLMAVTLGIPCPGCGMTRAALALLRGDVAHAFALHPVSPLLVPFAAGVVAAQGVSYLRGGGAFGTARVPRSIELIAAAFVVLVVAVWIARFAGYFGGPVSLR